MLPWCSEVFSQFKFYEALDIALECHSSFCFYLPISAPAPSSPFLSPKKWVQKIIISEIYIHSPNCLSIIFLNCCNGFFIQQCVERDKLIQLPGWHEGRHKSYCFGCCFGQPSFIFLYCLPICRKGEKISSLFTDLMHCRTH